MRPRKLYGLPSGVATLPVHVVPNVKVDRIAGEHAGAIKIKLRAPAIEGKANGALIQLLADRLKIPAREIILARGQKSRAKLIRIDNLTEDEIRQRLL